jgi:DNA polymerase I-like protein with 3'-5' exonuclease and polymerase domains
VKRHRPLAVDTETTGLRPWQGDKVKMASFADDSGAWAEAPDQAKLTLSKAVDEGRLIIMHNSPFDRAVFSANWGIEIPDDQFFDTYGADWLLDENQDHRLKEGVGKRLFGVDAKAEKDALRALMRGRSIEEVYRELRDVENEKPRAERERATDTRLRAREIADGTKRTWETLTYEELEPYAEQDAALTYGIYWHQQDALAEDGFVVQDLPRQHARASLSYRISKRGIAVDQDQAERGLVAAEERVAEILDTYGDVVSSPKKLGALLFDEWKLPVTKRTKTGGRSTDKDALESLSWDPRVQEILEYRALQKQVSAYYLPLLDRISKDGRVHPSVNPWRTVTGRWSMSGPNLTTIPRETTAAEIRKVFVPAPGMQLTEFDLSQVEPRVSADISGEVNLLSVYEAKGDIYQALADSIGVDRQTGKTVILSALYGVGAKKLATTLARGTGKEPDVARAKGILRDFWRHYHDLDRAYRKMSTLAERRGWIALPQPGRRRLFTSPANPYPRYYSAWNALVQGSAADLLANILLELDPAVQIVGQIVLMVHDSVVVEHEPGAEGYIHDLIDEITRDVSPFGIELPWESKRWA